MTQGEPEIELKEEGGYLIAGEVKYCPYGYTIWFSTTDLVTNHVLDSESGKTFVSRISGDVTIRGHGIEVIGLNGKCPSGNKSSL